MGRTFDIHRISVVNGATVNRKGHHGLSCRFSAGRHSRHGSINDIVQRALSSAGYQAVREPNGTAREDRMSHGRSLLWDVTVVDTLAQSQMNSITVATNVPNS